MNLSTVGRLDSTAVTVNADEEEFLEEAGAGVGFQGPPTPPPPRIVVGGEDDEENEDDPVPASVGAGRGRGRGRGGRSWQVTRGEGDYLRGFNKQG